MRKLADERDAARKALRSAHVAVKRDKEELMLSRRREADLHLELQALKQEAAATGRNATRAVAHARVRAAQNASMMEVRVARSACLRLRLLGDIEGVDVPWVVLFAGVGQRAVRRGGQRGVAAAH